MHDVRSATDYSDGVQRVTERPGGWGHYLAAFFLRLGGWSIGPPPPKLKKMVIVAAPHTAWMDGFWMMCFAWWWDMKLSWMIKSTTVRGPFGWFLRSVGAIPVRREAAHGLVGQMVEAFEGSDELYLSIPAEGTRSRRSHWKSGFYHIARQAGVPVCLTYLDYKNREAGFGPCLILTGDIRRDMDRIREFYKGSEMGKYPKLFTPPLLKEEDEARQAAE